MDISAKSRFQIRRLRAWPLHLTLAPPTLLPVQDVRLDNRFIDLRTPANQAIFRVQSAVCQVGTLWWEPIWVEGPLPLAAMRPGSSCMAQSVLVDNCSRRAVLNALCRNLAITPFGPLRLAPSSSPPCSCSARACRARASLRSTPPSCWRARPRAAPPSSALITWGARVRRGMREHIVYNQCMFHDEKVTVGMGRL